ncbi:MAG TPA: response regulator [Candidatus Binataceae bacterium]|nr:response regulator [Candidatus Binataceae bacterium]
MLRRSLPTRWELIPSRLEVSEDARALLMLRVTAALVAISQLALAAPALLARPQTILSAAIFYTFNILIGLIFVKLTFESRMLRIWRPVTLVGCVLLLGSVAVLALIIGHPEMFFVSAFLLVLGAGALLPWETEWQDCLSIAALLALGVLEVLGKHDHLTIFHWVGIGTAAAMGHFAASLNQQNRDEVNRQNLRLADNEAALRKALDSILDPLCIIDLRSQRYINVNEEFLVATGYTREEAIGKRWQELNIWFDEASGEHLINRVVSDLKVRNQEIMVRGADGMPAPALVSAVVLELGGRQCALFIARDVSRLKEIQRQLEAASRAALAASKAKSEFLSSMSHEIRTPMNAILGTADLLSETPLNSEQARYVSTLVSNGNALLELINSVLDLARMESGRLSLEATAFDLVEVVEKTIETLAVRADEKELELAIRFAPEVPTRLVGDPLRLRQVITNLIGNAIKFTDAGEVTITVEPDDGSAHPGFLRFTVSDTGIGIGPDKLANIFSAFTQADSSTTRKYGGSGLGLAIVERLVGLMDGQVWAESTPGKGSTFYFTAHFQIDTARAETPATPIPDLSGMRILITDDNRTSRGILSELLSRHGAYVAQSASGADSLSLIRNAGESGQSFHIVFVDQRMPEMDGIAMLQTLQRDSQRPPTTVLMVNSTAFSADRARMQELGLRYYLFKPIRQHDLFAMLSEIIGANDSKLVARKKAVVTPGKHSQDEHSKALRILLADDSPDNRLIVKAFLQKSPFQIDEAENGEGVVAKVKSNRYDLVLMDIQMPVLDGFAATRAIREWEHAQGMAPVPIVALTASALDEDVQRAREAGCNLHVSKPIKKKTLLAAIDTLTGEAEPTAAASMIALG